MTALSDVDSKRHQQRALLVPDVLGYVRVVATDSACVANTVDAVSTDADECGIIDAGRECHEPGFYLWEGTSRLDYENCEATTPTEVVYEGTVRAVLPNELPALLAMSPPEPEVTEE